MAACLCYIMCMQMPAETRDDTGFPGIGIKGSCEFWIWVLGAKPVSFGTSPSHGVSLAPKLF